MDRGVQVKFKPGSKARENWRVRDGSAGLVLARYRCATRDARTPERIDVHFGVDGVVWGERASEFEIVSADKKLS